MSSSCFFLRPHINRYSELSNPRKNLIFKKETKSADIAVALLVELIHEDLMIFCDLRFFLASLDRKLLHFHAENHEQMISSLFPFHVYVSTAGFASGAPWSSLAQSSAYTSQHSRGPSVRNNTSQ